MYKDIAISILGALLLEPVFKTTEVGEQIAMVMGLFFAFFARTKSKNGENTAREYGTLSKNWSN